MDQSASSSMVFFLVLGVQLHEYDAIVLIFVVVLYKIYYIYRVNRIVEIIK